LLTQCEFTADPRGQEAGRVQPRELEEEKVMLSLVMLARLQSVNP